MRCATRRRMRCGREVRWAKRLNEKHAVSDAYLSVGPRTLGRSSLQKDAYQPSGLLPGEFVRQPPGLPPHRWLLARQLERACDLLLASDLSLESIATRCGFADQSHFNRTFVKAFGVSPGHRRRSRRS